MYTESAVGSSCIRADHNHMTQTGKSRLPTKVAIHARTLGLYYSRLIDLALPCEGKLDGPGSAVWPLSFKPLEITVQLTSEPFQ